MPCATAAADISAQMLRIMHTYTAFLQILLSLSLYRIKGDFSSTLFATNIFCQPQVDF
jgi:hypothetical protein